MTDHVADVSDEEIAGLPRARFAIDPLALVAADVIVIVVPTPLRDGGPDLSMVGREHRPIVAGAGPADTEVAVAFYETIVDRVVTLSSPRNAEMAKLIENTFGYPPFWPGAGVGGHCIAIDPSHLSWKVEQEP